MVEQSTQPKQKRPKRGQRGPDEALSWQEMCALLVEEAAEDVPTRVACLGGTTAAQRTQVHAFLVFFSRYGRNPPVFVMPVGLADPGVGGQMEFNYQSSAAFFEFLQACNGVAWGGAAIQPRFSMCAQRPGGAWSTLYVANF